jgi:hypothetical protein
MLSYHFQNADMNNATAITIANTRTKVKLLLYGFKLLSVKVDLRFASYFDNHLQDEDTK